ncbi:MAG: TlpA disulfide reductase family protein, partial [Planctomycetota bacterium]
VTKRNIDLGDYAFAKPICLFFNRKFAEASEGLLAYLKTYDAPPGTEFHPWFGRVFISGTHTTLRKMDFVTAEASLKRAYQVHDSVLVFRSIGNRLMQGKGNRYNRMLNVLLLGFLSDPTIDDNVKQQSIQALYSTRLGRIKPGPEARPETKRVFQSFQAKDLAGKPLSDKDYRGKVLLIDFWATWCSPCLQEMPNVVRTYKKYKDRGFEIIGVSLDRRDAEGKLAATMKRFGMTWPQVYDAKGWQSPIATSNQVRRIPTTFLLDRHGRLRHTSLRGPALGRAVDRLLSEPVRPGTFKPAAKQPKTKQPNQVQNSSK